MTSYSLSSENEVAENHFQVLEKPGPRGVSEARQSNGGFYVRVDMPGVPPDGVKLVKRGETRTVTFTGKAPNVWRDLDESGRIYGGYVVLDRNPDEVDVEMTVVNGSLKLFFPNTEGLLHFIPSKTPVPVPKQLPVYVSPEADMRLRSEINPYMLDGLRGVYKVVQPTDDQVYLRVDMPGLGEENNRVRIEKGRILYFGGEGEKEHQLDEGGRTYKGGMMCDCYCCKMFDVKHEMKDGVFRLSFRFRSQTKPGSGRKCSVSVLQKS